MVSTDRQHRGDITAIRSRHDATRGRGETVSSSNQMPASPGAATLCLSSSCKGHMCIMNLRLCKAVTHGTLELTARSDHAYPPPRVSYLVALLNSSTTEQLGAADEVGWLHMDRADQVAM